MNKNCIHLFLSAYTRVVLYITLAIISQTASWTSNPIFGGHHSNQAQMKKIMTIKTDKFITRRRYYIPQ